MESPSSMVKSFTESNPLSGLLSFDNQFFTGGVGIALLGAGAQFLRRGSTIGKYYA